MKKYAISAIAAALSLSLIGCGPTSDSSSDSSSSQNGYPTMTISNQVSQNSGADVTWDISINSQYDNTVVTMGAWNYADYTTKYYTKFECNNGTDSCKDVTQIKCTLLGSSGLKATYMCKFHTATGDWAGDNSNVKVPFTTTDSNGNTVDVFMKPTISAPSAYGGQMFTDMSVKNFDVNKGNFY